MTITVVTYNVLADAYIRRDYYPDTPPAALEPDVRSKALLDRITSWNADVLCLQEVQAGTYPALQDRLSEHDGAYARKTGGKPDGCAMFIRSGARVASQNRYYD